MKSTYFYVAIKNIDISLGLDNSYEFLDNEKKSHWY